MPELSLCFAHPWHRPILAPPQHCGSHHNPGGLSCSPCAPPQPPGALCCGLTVADAVLVDSLHLAQQMVQSFSLSPPPGRPAVVLPPVCGDRPASPPAPLAWGKRASHPLLPHHLGVPPMHGSSCGCWAPLGVLGDPWVCATLPRNIQLCAAPCEHRWPPHSVARTQEREGTRFCLLLLHFSGLKK